jgi:hypothetical protein
VPSSTPSKMPVTNYPPRRVTLDSKCSLRLPERPGGLGAARSPCHLAVTVPSGSHGAIRVWTHQMALAALSTAQCQWPGAVRPACSPTGGALPVPVGWGARVRPGRMARRWQRPGCQWLRRRNGPGAGRREPGRPRALPGSTVMARSEPPDRRGDRDPESDSEGRRGGRRPRAQRPSRTGLAGLGGPRHTVYSM